MTFNFSFHSRKSALLAVIALSFFLTYSAIAQSPQDAPSSTPVATPLPYPPSDDSHEDLTKLTLENSDLRADPPLAGEVVHAPLYTRELIRVQWRHNDPIDLYVIRPAGKINPPVVLFLYSYPSESNRFSDDKLCNNLVKDGFAAVGFVSALTGQRYHDRPMSQWFISELHDSLVMTVHDVQMVLNYLDTRHDLDTNRIGIFGQGSGGAIAALTASVDTRLKAIDLMDPWGDWPDWVNASPQIPEAERSRFKDAKYLASIASLDPTQCIPKLGLHPVRIQENLFNIAVPSPVREQFLSMASSQVSVVSYRDQVEYAQKVSSNARMLDWLHDKLNERSKLNNTSDVKQP